MQHLLNQSPLTALGLVTKIAALAMAVSAVAACEKFKFSKSSSSTPPGTQASEASTATNDPTPAFLAPNKTETLANSETGSATSAGTETGGQVAPSISGTVAAAPMDNVVSAAIDNGNVTIVFVEQEKPVNLTFKKPADLQGDVKVEEAGSTIKAYHDGATTTYASFQLEVSRSKSLSFNLGSGNVTIDVTESPAPGTRIELIVSNGNIKLQPAKTGISKFKGADGIVNSGAVSASDTRVQITKNESFSSFSYSNDTLEAGPTLNIRLFGGNVSL